MPGIVLACGYEDVGFQVVPGRSNSGELLYSWHAADCSGHLHSDWGREIVPGKLRSRAVRVLVTYVVYCLRDMFRGVAAIDLLLRSRRNRCSFSLLPNMPYDAFMVEFVETTFLTYAHIS